MQIGGSKKPIVPFRLVRAWQRLRTGLSAGGRSPGLAWSNVSRTCAVDGFAVDRSFIGFVGAAIRARASASEANKNDDKSEFLVKR